MYETRSVSLQTPRRVGQSPENQSGQGAEAAWQCEEVYLRTRGGSYLLHDRHGAWRHGNH